MRTHVSTPTVIASTCNVQQLVNRLQRVAAATQVDADRLSTLRDIEAGRPLTKREQASQTAVYNRVTMREQKLVDSLYLRRD